MSDTSQNKNEKRPGEKFDAVFDRHWLTVLLRVLAICSIIYALTGFAGDADESRIGYGLSSALTLAVFAQILAYLQDLVRYAEHRANKEN